LIGVAAFAAIAWKVRGLGRASTIRTTQPQPPEKSGIEGRAAGSL
jgi:hypothetical protein